MSLNDDILELLLVVILGILIAFGIFFSVMTYVVWTYLTGSDRFSLVFGFGGVVLGLFSFILYFWDKLGTLNKQKSNVKFTELCKTLDAIQKTLDERK
jgi:uncharacterized membrane protein